LRTIRRTVAIIWLIVLGLTLGTGPASAHADLLNSDPKSGSTLATAPTHITLAYSERVDPGLSLVSVLDTSGRDIRASAVAVVAGQPRELSVSLPAHLPDGVYTVSWRAVSSDDGHVTAGAFAFGVGTEPGATPAALPPPASPGPSVLGVAGKVFLYAGLAVLFAAAIVGTFAFGGDIPARRTVLLIASSVAVAGALAMLFAEQHAVGVGLGTLLRSDVGTPYLWLLALVAATATASAWAETARNRWALPVVGVGAAAAMFVRAGGGHAAAATSAPWLQVGAQWLHFMSVGAWIGGLVLVSVLLRTHMRAGTPAPVAQIKRFSAIASWSVLVLAITGSIRAVNELGGIAGVRRLLDYSYGITLTIKVGIALVLVAIGGINRYRSIPRLADDGRLFRRVIGAELVASLALFGFTATLTSLPPTVDASRSTASAPASTSVSPAVGPPEIHTITVDTGVQLQYYIDPGTAGPSQFHVTAFSNGTELPLASATLSATPVGGNTRILVSTRLSAGHFVANTTLAAGDWRFGIQVTTEGGRTSQANFSQTIGAA